MCRGRGTYLGGGEGRGRPLLDEVLGQSRDLLLELVYLGVLGLELVRKAGARLGHSLEGCLERPDAVLEVGDGGLLLLDSRGELVDLGPLLARQRLHRLDLSLALESSLLSRLHLRLDSLAHGAVLVLQLVLDLVLRSRLRGADAEGSEAQLGLDAEELLPQALGLGLVGLAGLALGREVRCKVPALGVRLLKALLDLVETVREGVPLRRDRPKLGLQVGRRLAAAGVHALLQSLDLLHEVVLLPHEGRLARLREGALQGPNAALVPLALGRAHLDLVLHGLHDVDGYRQLAFDVLADLLHDGGLLVLFLELLRPLLRLQLRGRDGLLLGGARRAESGKGLPHRHDRGVALRASRNGQPPTTTVESAHEPRDAAIPPRRGRATKMRPLARERGTSFARLSACCLWAFEFWFLAPKMFGLLRRVPNFQGV